ncbi:MAG TPA: DUF3306 domain-containing protein [Xanthobacteraceae bacterium]
MSGLENFISRWGRLKRSAELKRSRGADLREDVPLSSAAATGAAGEGASAEIQRRAAPAFDPASLPSIDSITASTNIRAFLQSGVPAELTRAALRRVWVSDPVIRNFIGIAENQWDFTDPAAIPGFGPLRDTGGEAGLRAQAVVRLDKPLDRSAAGLPDNCAATEKLPSATDDSRCNRIDRKTGEAQTALATQRNREASDPAPDNNYPEATSQHSDSREGTSPRHGGAVPR